MKSSPTSKKNSSPRYQFGDPCPPEHPGWGWNTPERVEWAVVNFSPEKFSDYYQHRAADILRQSGDILSDDAKAALNALIS